MREKPRSWLRVHLSTAVVLMFAAGGLIGLNVPLWFRTWTFSTDPPDPAEVGQAKAIDLFNRTLAILGSLLVLFAVWFVCEWWIEWRSLRKKTPV